MVQEKRLREYVGYLRSRAAYLSDAAKELVMDSVGLTMCIRREAKAEGLREAAAGLEKILDGEEDE